MSFDAELIPAVIVMTIVFPDFFFGRLQRIMWGVKGGIKQKRLVEVCGLFEKLNSEVGDSVCGIEGTAVERCGNVPLFAIEPKRVVAGEVIGGA